MHSMPIQASANDELCILVENQGRMAYGSGINDFKVKQLLFKSLYFVDEVC